ncbi:ABC transporter ATP-binding protein [Devosia sp. PTR5]|uniref:ABC transporter ATP-binding protein n=1 Tax=Devosia oryzisoli TaxID=2774138 RepID=A0A927FVH5_9HYPH|nr:ABC transporter ATP-binding protein [Devosia oryzisoli]MBD8065588.1 ABC transporter ATP-binding protein [Devosia oryzisoli]
MSLVDIKDLRISFGQVPAVDGVSLAIDHGDRFGLIGESGSGKSLTALALAGLLPEGARVDGQILFDGQPLPANEAALARLRGRRIGMVFQEPMTALNPLMRVGDQIEESVALTRGDASAGAIVQLLQEVGLDPSHGRRYPHQLSGGQRQRVMIAIALAGEPDLMIADEPTSALDVITQRTVIDLIDTVCARRGMTLLFISHDIKVVAALCDHIAVMQQGTIVEKGTTEAVLNSPRDGYTRALLAASKIPRRRAAVITAGASVLDVENLSRVYRHGMWGRSVKLRAVDDVSFSLSKGECVALVGPSGCGKTTLARMLVGLDAPSSGTVTLDGEPVSPAKMRPITRAKMSLVFQDPFSSFDPRMTVERSVAEPLHLLRALSATEKAARVREAVEAVGLDVAVLERYPHEFSGGQRQRLAIARALVTRPSLVVLDEPVSALDVSIRGEVLALLAGLQEEYHLTYLLISHDLDLVAAVADRAMVMEAGRIVESGRPDDLFARPRHPMTRALADARLPNPA